MSITPTLNVAASAVIPSGETDVLSAELYFTSTGLCLSSVSAVVLNPFTGTLNVDTLPFKFEILGGVTLPATLVLTDGTTTPVSCQLTATNPTQLIADVNAVFSVAYAFDSRLSAGDFTTGDEITAGSGVSSVAISALRDEAYTVLVERGRMEILGFN